MVAFGLFRIVRAFVFAGMSKKSARNCAGTKDDVKDVGLGAGGGKDMEDKDIVQEVKDSYATVVKSNTGGTMITSSTTLISGLTSSREDSSDWVMVKRNSKDCAHGKGKDKHTKSSIVLPTTNPNAVTTSTNKFQILDNVVSFSFGTGDREKDDDEVVVVASTMKDCDRKFVQDIVVMTESNSPPRFRKIFEPCCESEESNCYFVFIRI